MPAASDRTAHDPTRSPAHPVLAGQIYESHPDGFLCRDGTRIDLGGPPDHTRIVITQVPGELKRTLRYRKVDPRPMGNGRPDRAEHPLALSGLARNYRLLETPDER